MKVTTPQRYLKDARLQMGLTQIQLAKRAKISQANICKIENCVKGVSLSDYIKITHVLGFVVKTEARGISNAKI
jgi:predicted transcriptional regulator